MDAQRARATEAMLAVSRTMTAIVARTLGDVAEQVTVPQLRVLVLLSTRGAMTSSTLAEHLGVNPSNAGRTCDQLVVSGRLLRVPDPGDGRSILLELTPEGSRFVAKLMAARRGLIDDVVVRMGAEDQRLLARGLEAFLTAVEAAPPEESIGLPDGRIIPWLL